MSKTTIQFYSGLKTIGGTIISIQYGKSRVIFDFGLVYNPSTNIFDGQINLRETAMRRDYLKLGLLPKIDGIYSEETPIHEPSILPASKSDVNTVILISHLHLDHMGVMGMIDPSIPVLMTDDSLRLYSILDTIGENIPGNRPYTSVPYNDSFSIGDIKITPLQVDHDVLGACAFHIETPTGSLVYTGDLRMHGAHPEYISSFIEQAKELGFDAIITEGTTLQSEEILPEALLVANSHLPENLLTEKLLPTKMAKSLKGNKRNWYL